VSPFPPPPAHPPVDAQVTAADVATMKRFQKYGVSMQVLLKMVGRYSLTPSIVVKLLLKPPKAECLKLTCD